MRKYLTNSNNISPNSKCNLKKNIKNLKLKKRYETDKTKNKINSNNRAIYRDFELNLLDFSTAKKNDKRDYIEIYISYVKTRHPLISSFFPINDYNLMSIKICLLFFTLALNIFVTSLFFTDDTMHKIVEDEGLFNFLYNLPLTIYSTIISIIINIIIKKLALSEYTIIEIKKENKLEDKEQLAKKIKKNLIIKFLLFFIFVFLLLLVFWFYIGCFCAVYANTQIYLIKDTLISFAFSLTIPFVKYLFACLIRIKSLNKPGQCLYNISQLLQ